ncbi:MAG: cation diffusion facilitator family transporter [Salinivirgaceae bacterium]|jgi:cation diffusion facilitator family transporter
MIKEKNRIALLSVFAAIFLTGFKLLVGILTGSLGILSEALHSGLDLVAAVITYFSVRVSDKPADKDHNYGHGKVENLSAFIETLLLLITCFWIIYEAIHRIISGKGLELNTIQTIFSFIVVITSIAIDVWRSRKLYTVAKKHNSQALEADALHFSTDIWSSGVVLLGLVCVKIYEWTHLPIFFYADSVAALGVAIIVLFVSYRLGKKAIDVLLDKAPQETIDKVQQTLATFPEVKHYHSLKVRTAGADTFIKFNIHLEPNMKLKKVHELCDDIEKSLNNLIERSEIYIHAEPQDSCHLDAEIPDEL